MPPFCHYIWCADGGLSWMLNHVSFYCYYYLLFLSTFESGGCLFIDEGCVWLISSLLLYSFSRHPNLTPSYFSVASLVFIGLYNLTLTFGFVDDGICNSCGKFGCHMKVLLNICAWLHGREVNIGCIKTIGVVVNTVHKCVRVVRIMKRWHSNLGHCHVRT